MLARAQSNYSGARQRRTDRLVVLVMMALVPLFLFGFGMALLKMNMAQLENGRTGGFVVKADGKTFIMSEENSKSLSAQLEVHSGAVDQNVVSTISPNSAGDTHLAKLGLSGIAQSNYSDFYAKGANN
jgi:hypothetical protein